MNCSRIKFNYANWCFVGGCFCGSVPPSVRVGMMRSCVESSQSFIRTAHSFACSELLASLVGFAALIRSLAYSLPSSWERGLSLKWMRQFHTISTHGVLIHYALSFSVVSTCFLALHGQCELLSLLERIAVKPLQRITRWKLFFLYSFQIEIFFLSAVSKIYSFF